MGVGIEIQRIEIVQTPVLLRWLEVRELVITSTPVKTSRFYRYYSLGEYKLK